MSEMLTVTVSEREETIPADFGCTPQEFAEACGYNSKKDWRVFRADIPYTGDKIPPEHECDEPMVVDDGDEFVVIPEYVGGG